MAKALIEAYEALYWVLRGAGYDSQRADQGAMWIFAFGVLIGIWLGIEVCLSLSEHRG